MRIVLHLSERLPLFVLRSSLFEFQFVSWGSCFCIRFSWFTLPSILCCSLCSFCAAAAAAAAAARTQSQFLSNALSLVRFHFGLVSFGFVVRPSVGPSSSEFQLGTTHNKEAGAAPEAPFPIPHSLNAAARSQPSSGRSFVRGPTWNCAWTAANCNGQVLEVSQCAI